jgi:hypothetical protein
MDCAEPSEHEPAYRAWLIACEEDEWVDLRSNDFDFEHPAYALEDLLDSLWILAGSKRGK